MHEQLTTGGIARAAGVNVETIRFYERRGLIEEPPRRRSGYRQYPPDTVARIRFIKATQSLGFSLEEIGELLALRLERPEACDRVRSRTEEKIAMVDAKIRQLRQIRRALARLVDACSNRTPTDTCPILEFGRRPPLGAFVGRKGTHRA